MAKNRPEILAEITDDFQLKFSIPSMLRAYLKQIGAGKKVRIDIARWYKRRTVKQNAVIWGPDYKIILAYLAEMVGEAWTAEELHDFHKRKFLGYKQSLIAEGLLRPKSTTRLDTLEFSGFREKYCMFWADRGLYLPDPDPEKG